MPRIVTYECEECGTEVVVTETGETSLAPIYCCGLEITEVSAVPKPSTKRKKAAGKTAKAPAARAKKAVSRKTAKAAPASKKAAVRKPAAKKTAARRSGKK